MRALPLLLLLSACEPRPHFLDDTGAFVSDGGADGGADGGTDGGADGGGDGGAEAAGQRCTLDPAPADDIETVRVGPDGAVVLADLTGAVYRYERVDDGGDCALDGAQIWDPADLQDAIDVELDGSGQIHVLVFYDLLVRLAPDGTELHSCAVPSGHGLAVTPDGSRAATVAVGADELAWVELSADDCAVGDPIPLPQAIGTHPAATATALVVDSHDPAGTLPPGVVLDAATGAVLVELGVLPEPLTGAELAGMMDLVVTDEGYLVAGSPDGGLWRLDAQGVVTQALDAALLVTWAEDPTTPLAVRSIAWSADGPSYIAAGFLDASGVWALDL